MKHGIRQIIRHPDKDGSIRRAVAEFAALAGWEKEDELRGDSYDGWDLAFGRDEPEEPPRSNPAEVTPEEWERLAKAAVTNPRQTRSVIRNAAAIIEGEDKDRRKLCSAVAAVMPKGAGFNLTDTIPKLLGELSNRRREARDRYDKGYVAIACGAWEKIADAAGDRCMHPVTAVVDELAEWRSGERVRDCGAEIVRPRNADGRYTPELHRRAVEAHRELERELYGGTKDDPVGSVMEAWAEVWAKHTETAMGIGASKPPDIANETIETGSICTKCDNQTKVTIGDLNMRTTCPECGKWGK